MSAQPRARRPVAVLLSRFPLITETFILREVIEMERQGQPVRLVPILHERPEVVHREALPWIDRAMHAPLVSAAVLAANLRALRRQPGRLLRLFASLIWASAASPGLMLRTLALFPKAVWAAERLEAEGVAHLHAHYATHPATLTFIVSSLTGIPWSVTVHAHDIFVSQAMLRQKLAAAQFVRAISHFNREFLERRFPGATAGKVQVIHVGIEPDAHRSLPPPPAGPPGILCVASLRPYKGHAVLLDACRLLRDEGMAFRCELVGEGPLRTELERRIAELGLDGAVHLLGALPQHEVVSRLGETSVFVLPSVVAPDGQMEGIPVALMEAMAAGRPVVASALSGVPELVEDGVSGFLTRPGDAAGIAAALKRLFEEPGLGQEMGVRGREKVEAAFRLKDAVTDLLILIDQHAEPIDPDVEDLLGQAGLAGAGVRRVHRRADSIVIEALAPGARELVVKSQRSRPGESRPPVERARHEFQVLSCLHRRLGGVPRPLRLVEAAVVMERCPGEAFDEMIRRGRAARGPQWEELLAALRRAGEWLRRFQRLTRKQEDAAPTLEALLGRAAADLHECRRQGLLSVALLRRLEARLAELPQKIGSARRVGHHGDFWPGNLFLGKDGGAQAIDFEGYREGLPWEDAAYFLIHLELFFSWPGLKGRGERARAAFVAGWLDGEPLDRPALDLCRIAQALQLLARGSPGGWRQRRTLVSTLRRTGAEP